MAAKSIFHISLSYSSFLYLSPAQQIPQTANQSLHNLFQTNLFSSCHVYVPQIFLFNLTSTLQWLWMTYRTSKYTLSFLHLPQLDPAQIFPSAGNKILLFSAPAGVHHPLHCRPAAELLTCGSS